MTVSLLHSYQSAIADSGDSSVVQPSNWNAEHVLEMATNKLLGRGTAGTGAVEEITLGTGLSLSGTTLNVTVSATPGGSSGQLQYNNASAFGGSILWQGTNIIEQRNSTNAQALNVYNTYTDGSNYERATIKYSSNLLVIGHEGAGTGNNGRNISFLTSGFYPLTLDSNFATFNVAITATGRIDLTSDSSTQGYISMKELTSAPSSASANTVRIYAEDNGSGKTRLMAIFSSGAAQQIAIEP